MDDSEALEVCRECGKRFKIKRLLRKHMRTVHTSESDMIKCEVCGKLTKNKRAYNAHIKVSFYFKSEVTI